MLLLTSLYTPGGIAGLLCRHCAVSPPHRRALATTTNPSPSSRPDPRNAEDTSAVGSNMSKFKIMASDQKSRERAMHGNRELVALEELNFTEVPPDLRSKETFVAAIRRRWVGLSGAGR
jgi:hypothetical protein